MLLLETHTPTQAFISCSLIIVYSVQRNRCAAASRISHSSSNTLPASFPLFTLRVMFPSLQRTLNTLWLISWTLNVTLQDLTLTFILKPRNPCCDNVKTCMSQKRQVLPVTYTNTLWRMLYTEQFHCMLHHSISDSSRKGRHIQFITTNKLLKKKFIFFH